MMEKNNVVNNSVVLTSESPVTISNITNNQNQNHVVTMILPLKEGSQIIEVC